MLTLRNILRIIKRDSLSLITNITGIRKVMGGSTREMMTLIASALAVPLALLYLDSWLNDYAIRIQLYWWIFASSIMVVLIFQTLITLGQTRRTARRNPVEALRYE